MKPGDVRLGRNPDDPSVWDLIVHGRREISGESFAICDEARYAILGEIVERIRGDETEKACRSVIEAYLRAPTSDDEKTMETPGRE